MTRELAGVDLGQYNSVVSAQDIAHLTEALGYTDGYDLYGTSYGTRLAQYAMRTTPEHDPQRGPRRGERARASRTSCGAVAKRFESYVALFEQCAADAACNAAYPDLAARFGALLDKLEKTPLVFDPPLVVNPQLTFAFPPVLKQIDADFFVQLAGLNNLVMNGGFAGAIPRISWPRSRAMSTSSGTPAWPPRRPRTEQVQTVVPTSGDATPRFKASQPLFQAPFETLLMLAQAVAAQAETGIDSQWLSVVLGDLAKRLQAGEDEDELMEALLHLSVVPNTGTTAQHLIDYATTYLSPSAAEAANAVVGHMTRNDVRSHPVGHPGHRDDAGREARQPEHVERDDQCVQLRRRGGVHLAGRGAGIRGRLAVPAAGRLPDGRQRGVHRHLPVVPHDARSERDRSGRQRHPHADLPGPDWTPRRRSPGAGRWPRG